MYLEKIYTLLFLCLGGAFLLMGLLCFSGVIMPSPHSYVQYPVIMGAVFSSMGAVFCVVQAVFRIINSVREKRRRRLLNVGTALQGTVEKVCLLKHVRFGNQSPYRIRYIYTCQDKTYRHKSCLLWEKPGFREGDPILVYGDCTGKSTVMGGDPDWLPHR